MKFKINEIDGATRELVISVSKFEFEEKLNEQLLSVQKQINLKGFRPGKVPISLIKSIYGKELEEDFIGDYATELFRQVVDTNKIMFIGKPSFKNFQKEQDNVIFTFQYDIVPEFELNEYKGLKIYEPIHRVTDEEIEHEILHRRLYSARPEKTDQVKNEFSVVEIEIFKIDPENKEPLHYQKSQKTTILLHSEKVPMELRNLFINRKSGESFLYNPHQIDTSAENEEVLIQIKEIYELIMDDLNDEFVQKYTNGRLMTVDEFKEEIGYSIQERWDLRSNDEMVKQVIKLLVESHEFDLPISVLNETALKMSEDFIKKYSEHYPSLRDKKPEDIIEDFIPIAESQVKWAIIKKKIIEKENIRIEDYDIESLVQEYQTQNPNISEEEIKNYILNNAHITDTLLEKKVLDFLIGFAETTEIDFEEYEKMLEEKLPEGTHDFVSDTEQKITKYKEPISELSDTSEIDKEKET